MEDKRKCTLCGYYDVMGNDWCRVASPKDEHLWAHWDCLEQSHDEYTASLAARDS